MSKPSEVLKKFCSNHAIQVVDTNKRACRYRKVNIDFFRYSDDYNKVDTVEIINETEPLYTVQIAESELEKIADFENMVFKHMAETGRYGMFEAMMYQKEEEQYLRDRYPAVQKAYEQYSMMLKLAKSGEL